MAVQTLDLCFCQTCQAARSPPPNAQQVQEVQSPLMGSADQDVEGQAPCMGSSCSRWGPPSYVWMPNLFIGQCAPVHCPIVACYNDRDEDQSKFLPLNTDSYLLFQRPDRPRWCHGYWVGPWCGDWQSIPLQDICRRWDGKPVKLFLYLSASHIARNSSPHL